MSLSTFAFIITAVTLSAFGQLSLKLAMSGAHITQASSKGALAFVSTIAISPMVWIGLMIYGCSVVLWLWVLSKVELSVAYPFVGVSFIITLIFSVFILNEAVTPTRIAGIMLIAAGCALVGRSA